MPFASRILEYIVLSIVIAPFTFKFAGMDRKGSAAAFFIGFIVYVSLGFRGFIVLLSLHIVGAAVTKLGYEKKKMLGVAQKKRSLGNVAANGLVPAAAAGLSAVLNPYSQLFYTAYVSTVAAATADTVSSEIGELSGKKPKLITTFEEVDPGTDGAVSLLGTFSGLISAAFIALIAIVIDPSRPFPLILFAVATTAGLVGTTIDSILGATLERKGVIRNDAVNLLSLTTALVYSSALYLNLA